MKNNNVKLVLLTLSVLFLLSFVSIEGLSTNAAVAPCIDSDGGRVYTVRGTVRAINGTNVSEYTDYCQYGNYYLIEYYCFNRVVREEFYYCQNMGSNYQCIDGRCATNRSTGNFTGTKQQRFKSPINFPQFLVNTTTCTINAVPNYGVGPFTSNVTARFFNSTGPFPFTATLKCHQNDAGINFPIWSTPYNGFAISRLCNYPQVNQPTSFIASASGDGASCNVVVTDMPQPQTCVDTDGGRNYGVRGLTYTNYTQNYTDRCQDNLRLREYWCSGNYIANEIVSCSGLGNYTRCSLGRCIRSGSGSRSPSFMKAAPPTTRSRFFLWGLFDIFRGRSTGNVVRETSNDDGIFGWLILGVILVAGLMYYNKKQNTSSTETRERQQVKRRR